MFFGGKVILSQDIPGLGCLYREFPCPRTQGEWDKESFLSGDVPSAAVLFIGSPSFNLVYKLIRYFRVRYRDDPALWRLLGTAWLLPHLFFNLSHWEKNGEMTLFVV